MSAPSRGVLQRLGRRVRRHLLGVFLAFGVGTASTWYFREAIFTLLLVPGGESLSPHGGLPIFTVPTEMLGATIQLAMRGGFVAALPVLMFSVFNLLRPLLPPQQRRFVVIFLPALFLCFLGGAAFAYFVMLPTAFRFLLHFGAGVAVPLISITEYMSLLMAMMFWLGVIFDLPLAMFLLAKMRIVSYRRFRKWRKLVPVTAFVLSALITPTFDIINQTMVAVPIILLFEVGLFLAWLARPEEGAHRVMTKITSVIGGLLRRLAVLVALPLAVFLGLIYVIALAGVFVWDGNLGTHRPSRGRAGVDRAYRGALAVIARVAFLTDEGASTTTNVRDDSGIDW
jgi:sec-independent protein translocase protein TatC